MTKEDEGNITFGEFMAKAERGELNDEQKKRLEEMGRVARDGIKHIAEKEAQPFVTNSLLENLIKQQTPKWISYAILGVTGLAFIIGLVALLHSYGMI